jgi:hypothetical protein
MLRYDMLPDDAEGFVEDLIRRGSGAREISHRLQKSFGIRRGKSWLAKYIADNIRPNIAEHARLQRRLRCVKREFGDRPELLAKLAKMVNGNFRRNKAPTR